MRSLTALADIDVERLRGVGEAKRAALGDAGINTVLDLLTHYPRRYLDRSAQAKIAELGDGQEATVLAEVKKVAGRRTRQGRALVEIDVFDGASYMHVVFFNQAWRSRQLSVGMSVVLFGKVDRYKGRRQMTNPVVDLVGDRTGRIVPVYPQSEKLGLTSWEIGGWISEAIDRAGELVDPLRREWRDRLDLVGRSWAMTQIHLPESMGAATVARRRLAFDELLRLQMILVMRKRAVERDSIGIRHRIDGELVRRFREGLPFPLTSAQERAIAEIDADLAGPRPMHRLLQGDVGAGKTVVAVAALLDAVQGGHQGALMAPTEVLAEQHHAGVRALLEGLAVPAEGHQARPAGAGGHEPRPAGAGGHQPRPAGAGGHQQSSLFADRPLRVALLTSRAGAAERRRLHADLAGGTIDICVGTHALLTEGVAFASLGVVVIDEQHRFGVEQRSALREKGDGTAVPDVLVMTATPIPRTAAMTVYGDLDTTVLDELPPGRTPIVTTWARGAAQEDEAWKRVRSEVGEGRQAYVVCPLVEGSERVQARSASEERDRLAGGELAGLRLGLLHGQLPAREKEETMGSFRRGEVDVLVATTVIEVGVDVPGATVMVIEDADHFGIAQLHQLRGRVGRGADPSWCYLLADGIDPDAPPSDASARLSALEGSTDGFELAEVDLELRGEGTILGARQKGVTDLKLASLRCDRELVVAARQVAFAIVDTDPFLDRHGDLADEVRSMVDDDDREFLFKS
ncbi:MAG TPA: ATP-dependent DNA helicase RecG [Acidimicrobiales bacterium]|nr:ATP-dependent DNA helicase RecG [Acidimicrobiales bacterium]